jgi:hypothetical protein
MCSVSSATGRDVNGPIVSRRTATDPVSSQPADATTPSATGRDVNGPIVSTRTGIDLVSLLTHLADAATWPSTDLTDLNTKS